MTEKRDAHGEIWCVLPVPENSFSFELIRDNFHKRLPMFSSPSVPGKPAAGRTALPNQIHRTHGHWHPRHDQKMRRGGSARNQVPTRGDDVDVTKAIGFPGEKFASVDAYGPMQVVEFHNAHDTEVRNEQARFAYDEWSTGASSMGREAKL